MKGMEEMNDHIKKVISRALDLADELAKDTSNPFDDIIVLAATKILRKVFGIEVK